MSKRTPNDVMALPGARIGIVIERFYEPVTIAIVDALDYQLLGDRRWGLNGGGYASSVLRVGRGVWRSVTLHRLLLDPPVDVHVDHIDGDRLNNTRSNLRLATKAQNNVNTKLRVDNACGLKGVSWRKRERAWLAQIQHDGHKRWIGLHSTAEAAARAYDEAAIELHGEFASTNVKLGLLSPVDEP